MRMHPGRRLHLGDAARLTRVAHVVNREPFRTIVARSADRADIGIALMDFDDAAAAPSRRGIMAEQFEAFRLLGNPDAHLSAPGLLVLPLTAGAGDDQPA